MSSRLRKRRFVWTSVMARNHAHRFADRRPFRHSAPRAPLAGSDLLSGDAGDCRAPMLHVGRPRDGSDRTQVADRTIVRPHFAPQRVEVPRFCVHLADLGRPDILELGQALRDDAARQGSARAPSVRSADHGSETERVRGAHGIIAHGPARSTRGARKPRGGALTCPDPRSRILR